MRELHLEARPTTFKQVVGQPEAVAQLTSLGKGEGGLPHCILFTGPSGCGKTTLARIIRRKLKCADHDFVEVNAAENRGIDMVRGIQTRIGLAPMGGKCRVWLIDECFPAGTMVRTPYGETPIEDIHSGSIVMNISGHCQVRRRFVNTIPLSRVTRVDFSDGTHIFTTAGHKFLTAEGWFEAEHLPTGVCILGFASYNMGNITKKPNEKNVPHVQDRIYGKKKQSRMLRKKLCGVPQSTAQGAGQNHRKDVPRMHQSVYCAGQEARPGPDTLQYKLFENSLDAKELAFATNRGSEGENIRITQDIQQHGIGQSKETSSKCPYVSSKSDGQSRSSGENDVYQGRQRHATGVAGGAWWEPQLHQTPIAPIPCSRSTQMETRAPHTDQGAAQTGVRIPNMLQNGFSNAGDQIRHRGRWEESFIEKSYHQRQEEDPQTRRVRVVGVTVYQRGSNDESFEGIIGDRERALDSVQFYDLQIDGHPSYFANGLPVHNCHQLTAEAQGAFLKLLEEPPEHAYIMLATTNPEKLRQAIRTRATEIKVRDLTEDEIKKLVERVAEDYDTIPDPEVVDRLAEVSEGSARKALVLLQQIMGIDDTEEQLSALQNADAKQAAIEIARALMAGKPWGTVAKIIKGCDEEPESLRWMVLSYFSTVALGGGKGAGRAVEIIKCFECNYFDTKKAGLIASCYDACNL